MKAPFDATPSGDRAVARLFITLLARRGYAPELCSTLRAYLGDGSPGKIAALQRAADAEIERIVADELQRGEPPAFVFTYHVYYKAPDLIGPALARRLAVPYVVAEASRASKRAVGPFAQANALAMTAIDAARLVFATTQNDREALDRFRPPHQAIIDLKPFIDVAAWPERPVVDRPCRAPPRLLTVAMMRAGDKTRSYRLLVEALAALHARPWRLDIVGDGPNRAEIEAMVAPFGDRVRLHGQIDDPAEMSAFYRDADLFVWPGVNEAYGMVYLEAQAHGAPCIAGADGGVTDVVQHGETGILVAKGDAQAMAQALDDLITDEARYLSMRRAAARFARETRSLDQAMATVAAALSNIGIAPLQRLSA